MEYAEDYKSPEGTKIYKEYYDFIISKIIILPKEDGDLLVLKNRLQLINENKMKKIKDYTIKELRQKKENGLMKALTLIS